MALQAGNRTWYNPTHGIDWRGSRLPFNTFYALLCLFLFFFMALIIRLCYKNYRSDIHKLEKKHAQHIQQFEKAKSAVAAKMAANGYLTGILKNTENNAEEYINFDEQKQKAENSDVSKSVQFAEEAEERLPYSTEKDRSSRSQIESQRKISNETCEKSNVGWLDSDCAQVTCHL